MATLLRCFAVTAATVQFALGFGVLPALGQQQQVRPDSTHEVRQRQVRIPMPDGTRLWACLTYPTAADERRAFPALLVMDPYAGQCSLTYYYEGPLARHGYAVAYVQVRGSGLSEGSFFEREYSQQELDDAVEVIGWLAGQPWSTGKVGMYGWSWSGFNALQVAMRAPEALDAIIANVATENLYHEDVHYADGIFRYGPYNIFADLNLIYTPPPLDPADPDLLAKRFDRPPLSLLYLKRQTDGAFWRERIRLDESTGALSTPTYLIGGFYDGYRSAVPRTLRHAQGPVKAVVGPWKHSLSTPAPQADLVKLMVRWWDYWLKGEETGVMDDPDLMAYLRAPYQPLPKTSLIPGQWKGVERWPPALRRVATYHLGGGHALTRQPAQTDTLAHRYVPTAGAEAGIWWGGVLGDQRAAEASSLIFETDAFDAERALLGRPEARIHVSATARHANWVVRLSDVAPDGTATRITGAAINGTHRTSSVRPAYLVPGKKYKLTVPLHFTSWIFKPGHKMRVSISNATWPMFWPTPFPMTTALYVGPAHPSSIELPLIVLDTEQQSEAVAKRLGSRNVSRAAYAAQRADSSVTAGGWGGPSEIIRDVAGRETRVIYAQRDSSGNPRTARRLVYTLSDDAPAEAAVEATSTIALDHEGGRFVWEGTTTIRSDEEHFYYEHVRVLKENGEVIRRKMWEDVVERRFQ